MQVCGPATPPFRRREGRGTTPLHRGALPRRHRATKYWKRDIVLKCPGDAEDMPVPWTEGLGPRRPMSGRESRRGPARTAPVAALVETFAAALSAASARLAAMSGCSRGGRNPLNGTCRSGGWEPHSVRECPCFTSQANSAEHLYRSGSAGTTGTTAARRATSRCQWALPWWHTSPKVLNQTVKVCAVCNNGWMSQLEERARPVLLCLVVLDAAAITVAEQAVLSQWLFKSAVLHELQCRSLAHGEVRQGWSAHVAAAAPGESTFTHHAGPVVSFTHDDGCPRASAPSYDALRQVRLSGREGTLPVHRPALPRRCRSRRTRQGPQLAHSTCRRGMPIVTVRSFAGRLSSMVEPPGTATMSMGVPAIRPCQLPCSSRHCCTR